jgi:hypothetical protein
MLTLLARLRHGCLSVALLVLLTAFASGRTLAHVPALQEPARVATAAAPHCHTDGKATAPKPADFCKSFCAIGSQERLAATATVVPAPSVTIKTDISAPPIGLIPEAVNANTTTADTVPPPLRRLSRDRRLLI